MKPEGALTFKGIEANLSTCSFEEALIHVGCFPLCTLRVSAFDLQTAQRVVGAEAPVDQEAAVVSPRVNIVLDESYGPYEWSVEYNGKIFWSGGA